VEELKDQPIMGLSVWVVIIGILGVAGILETSACGLEENGQREPR
jgi:hypothetical protein